MSRSTVAWGLMLYFGAVLAGAILQIDHFPLTWVPMYSGYFPATEPPAEIQVDVRDKKEAAKGFFATHRDGSQSRIGMHELNIARRNMWRLYYQRIFGKGPPKFAHANRLAPLSRWVRGLGAGESSEPVDWQRRLFFSVNSTLGLQPEDPGFVVRLEAFQEIRSYTPEYVLKSSATRHADVRFDEAWAEDFAR